MRARNALAAGLLLSVALAGAAPAPHAFKSSRQVADLRYLERKLLQHPLLQEPGKLAAFRRFASGIVARAAQPLSAWRFALAADQMANWFHDPHTMISAQSPSAPLEYIPVLFYWSPQGLLAVHMPGTPKQVTTGDRVLAISGITPAKLLRRLPRFFSGSRYWLRSAMLTEGLSEGTILHWLGAVGPGGTVTLRLQRASGASYTVALALRAMTRQMSALWNRFGAQISRRLSLPPGLHWTVGPVWRYAVTPRYGYFVLAQCDDTPAYERAVDAFFRQVQAAGAPNVILDLRGNPGGNSAVINRWLQHLPPAYAASAGFLEVPVQPVFQGHLYVMESWNTFSSATLMVEALTGPGLGVRVGQPMGEATGGWGDVQEYELPYSHVYFQVSTRFIHPVKGPLLPTLKPQIPLALTAADLRQGINPVARWLRTLTQPPAVPSH